MGAVDRMDRSVKDWGLTQRLGRYYMRIVFWLVDAAIHNMFILRGYARRGSLEKVLAGKITATVPFSTGSGTGIGRGCN